MNVHYTKSTNREYHRSRHIKALMGFHYMLHLNDAGEIVGGQYYRDSAQLDMLWTPLQPVQGGEEGNKRGNPYVDVDEVLAIWRESVPEDLRLAWLNIDPTEEDRVVVAGDEEETSVALAPAVGAPEIPAEAAAIAVGDVLILDSDAATFWLPGRTTTTLARGTRFTVTEVRSEWIGGYVVLEAGKKKGWVRKSDIEIGAEGIETAVDGNADTPMEISAINVGDILVLKAEAATLSLPGRTTTTLVRGTRFIVTEVRTEWIGGHSVVAGVKQRGWVRRSEIASAFTPLGSSAED
jgi:hypothetical protein